MTTIRRSGLTRTNTPFEYTPDKIQNTCKNVNTTNVLNPSFHGTKKGTTADIIRPEFKQGISSLKLPISTADIKNKRSGLGNNLIIRPNFAAPSVPPRQVVDYLLQAKLESQQGMKVTLGDSTFTKLFEITVGDPLDVEWIAEYNRRKALGEKDEFLKINPPLGRPQRVMKKMVNFAEATNLANINSSSLSITEQLKTIEASLTASASSTEVKDALAKIFAILGNTDTLTADNNKLLTKILNSSSNIPTKAKLWFGADSPRFMSFRQYNENTGLVKAYLLKKPLEAPDKLVYGKSGNAVALSTGINDMRVEREGYTGQGLLPFPVNNFYLDVETKMIVNRDFVVTQVIRGVDNGQIDGQNPPVDPSTGAPQMWMTLGEEMSFVASETATPTGLPMGKDKLPAGY